MKLLIDECLDVRLRHHSPEHDARTVDYMGWKSIGNGSLIALARQEFDIFITRDQSIPEQQSITAEEIPIIIIYPRSDSLKDMIPLVPQVVEVLPIIRRGQVVKIRPDSEPEFL